MIKWLKEWNRRRLNRKWWGPEQQLEYLRTIVQLDHRWLAHDKTADALTERYLKLLSPEWHKESIEDVAAFRARIGLDPHYNKRENE